MKLFIDTANLDEIREAASWGILDGCTTNPSLMAREGQNFAETIHKICEIVQGPVSAEVVAQDAEGMLREARLVRQIHEQVVVKVPMSHEGLKATRVLADEGTPVNVTLVFSVNQALLAAKAGAAYVSPFIGRIDDTGQDGIQVLADIVEVFNTYYFD
ncbi:MAG: transaldolase family protein, partial [Myxococcota bacterium]|nr:transaldolase family protein [Myxococcota bacterium]